MCAWILKNIDELLFTLGPLLFIIIIFLKPHPQPENSYFCFPVLKRPQKVLFSVWNQLISFRLSHMEATRPGSGLGRIRLRDWLRGQRATSEVIIDQSEAVTGSLDQSEVRRLRVRPAENCRVRILASKQREKRNSTICV